MVVVLTEAVTNYREMIYGGICSLSSPYLKIHSSEWFSLFIHKIIIIIKGGYHFN